MIQNYNQNALGYIYKTTNLINNRFYIGQHRSKQFEPNNYLGSGTILQKALNNYGKQNFKCELLDWGYSPEDLNKKEVYWIDFYDAYKGDLGYNLTKGGEGALGAIQSEYTRHLKSIAMKDKLNAPVICIETQKKYDSLDDASLELGIAASGISRCCKGFQYTCCGYHWAYLDDIDRQNYFKSFIGQPRGQYHLRSPRAVICIETQIIYSSIDEATKATGLKDISACVRGEASHTDGYHWSYLENKEKFQPKPTKLRKNIKVMCVETGEIFNSLKDASYSYYGTDNSGGLSDALRKPTKTFKGFHWVKV